jgi:autotransporter family porin
MPSGRMLRDWRKHNKMPYRRFVDGRFTGTTDEIIQWAAYKWGLDEDVLRAVAVVESWWRQSTVGGHGSSFGLFQVRAPFHCSGKCAIARRSTAFNADYYGGILRAYYDGRMRWLNKEPHGRKYVAGDLWGSVGAWFSGRWWTQQAASYISVVQQRLSERTWAQAGF